MQPTPALSISPANPASSSSGSKLPVASPPLSSLPLSERRKSLSLFSSYTFSILDTVPVPSGSGKNKVYTAYVIKVSPNGGETFDLLKRFRQFYCLDQHIKEKYGEKIVKAAATMPGKIWLNPTDPTVVQKRCRKLEKYLNDLNNLSDVWDMPYVRRFLSSGVEDAESDDDEKEGEEREEEEEEVEEAGKGEKRDSLGKGLGKKKKKKRSNSIYRMISNVTTWNESDEEQEAPQEKQAPQEATKEATITEEQVEKQSATTTDPRCRNIALAAAAIQKRRSAAPPPPAVMDVPTWTVRALYDYTPEDTVDGLAFQAGDVLEVTSKVHSDWWYAKMGGKTGYIPVVYVKECESNGA